MERSVVLHSRGRTQCPAAGNQPAEPAASAVPPSREIVRQIVLHRMRVHGSRAALSASTETPLESKARGPITRLLGCTVVTAALALAVVSPAGADGRLDATIRDARESLLAARRDGRYWSFPAYLGPHFVSQYAVFLDCVGGGPSLLDAGVLRGRLLDAQRADGSWYAVRDAGHLQGDLDATILNYWALATMQRRSPPEERTARRVSAALERARAWIIGRGGLDRASMLVRVQLALTGNLPWNEIPLVPHLLFKDWSPVHYRCFAQWIEPHLRPIAYMRRVQLTFAAGGTLRLDELRGGADPASLPAPRAAGVEIGGRRDWIGRHAFVGALLARQQPAGSWGGYTVSTLLSVLVLEHYMACEPAEPARVQQAIARGIAFLERMYLGSGSGAYLGVTMDGRYWDTALAALALGESGVPGHALREVGSFLMEGRNRANGGFAFGLDFGDAPDTDDSAITILALRHLGPEMRSPLGEAREWLLSMQNRDGGWGAFDRDNEGSVLLRSLARRFMDSADLFDDSSPDVTGHVLEALAAQGDTVARSAAVQRAVRYLREKQDPAIGAWSGRWGINYIYGTCAAVVGLTRAGVDAREPFVDRAVRWLGRRQNADGGFGESTLSYVDIGRAGAGPSTPSQTAWALMALVAAGSARGPHAGRAAGYLIRARERSGDWTDESTVGTGHPGMVYMDYPSYPKTFPLLALARYARALRD
jgi:squalene-hopene/tetraprenyl-beta-curcumene cyclase